MIFMDKSYSKLISLLLCVSILLALFPSNIFAQENTSTDSIYDIELDTELTTLIYDENGNLISESQCNCLNGVHNKDCSLYKDSFCDCELEDGKHNISCEFYIEENNFDSINEIVDDTKPDGCTCDFLDSEHSNDCSLFDYKNNNCTCNCLDEIHLESCPLYITPICNCESEIHNTDCYLYEEIIPACTCNQEIHILGCPLYESPVNECTCGTEAEIHLTDCPFYEKAEDLICNCNFIDEIHSENCPLYVVKEEFENECICESIKNGHSIDCSMYVGPVIECICNTSDDIHSENCPLYIELEESLFKLLLETNSLDEFFGVLMSEENFSKALELSAEEIFDLQEHINILYKSIESPSSDDIALKDELLETLSILPNGSLENEVKLLNYLEWSGTVSGLTLTQDVVLIGDTYMTSKINIPSGTIVTIDLNGYMLHGSGNGTIIDNDGTLTIKDSRPNHGSHRFTKVTDGPWVLDENGEYEVVGGLITGGRDLTAVTAGSSGGGVVKQGTNTLSNVLYIEGGTFIGNSSTRAGGAFYGGAVTMSGGLVIGNYASGFAGGISLSGSFVMTGGEIRENETDVNSSYNNSNSSRFYDNASVIIGQKSSFDMSGGKLVGNLSTVGNKTGTTTFSMTGGEVVGNFRILNGLDADLSGGEINGSVYLKKGSCIVSNDMLIYGGTRDNGGAIYVTGGNFSMSGGTISGSDATNGGAVYVDGGTFTMTNGLINNNTADNGGAVYISGGSFELYGGTISNNGAINGGAAYIDGGNLINIYNGIIDSNTASNNGGAIYATSDTTDILINVFDGQITNNTAGNHAGAIGASVDGELKITINIGEEECLGANKIHHDDFECPIIKNNVANFFGGAFCLHGNANGLLVNVYCGDVDGNLALRYPGSNTINQEGGKFAIYGGVIDPGVMVGGGIFDDNRVDAKTIKVRFWGNYEGAPTEPVIIECTLGVTLNFPANTYVNGSHELSGWTNVPNSQEGWVPVGGQYAVYEDEDEYLDYYAVWDAVVSFIVYIPDTLDIGSNGTGEIDIAADLNYFKKDSNLEVIVNSDFMLTNVEDSNDIIYYELRTDEPGINGVLENGEVVASFQYNNTGNKTLTANVLEVVNAGTYEGLLTFVVQYSED